MSKVRGVEGPQFRVVMDGGGRDHEVNFTAAGARQRFIKTRGDNCFTGAEWNDRTFWEGGFLKIKFLAKTRAAQPFVKHHRGQSQTFTPLDQGAEGIQ